MAAQQPVVGLAGALSAALANPIDMVRTRIHAQAGGVVRYASTLAAAAAIVSGEGGVGALYRGLGATAARQALLSGGQLASYDQAKEVLRGLGFAESTGLHMGCALLSGFFAQAAAAHTGGPGASALAQLSRRTQSTWRRRRGHMRYRRVRVARGRCAACLRT